MKVTRSDRFPQITPQLDGELREASPEMHEHMRRLHVSLREWRKEYEKVVNASTLGIFNVKDYGAKGDGSTNDTNAFQAAIDAAEDAGGGTVLVPSGRYYFTGVLTLPRYVSLVGTTVGPIGVYPTGLKNPAVNTFGPTLLPTNTGSVFITANGGRISDLLFYYPNQVGPDTSTPTVYPATIDCANSKVYRCTFLNSYHAITISVGQSRVENCFIGALAIGIYMDTCYDVCIVSKCHFYPNYDYTMDNALPAASPSALGTWALANGIGMDIRRADSVILSNLFIYQYEVGIQLADSPSVLSPDTGHGVMSNIVIENVVYGILCYASNTAANGWKITNLTIEEGGAAGVAAISLPGGGSDYPEINVVGGRIIGTWSSGPYSIAANSILRMSDVFGVTDVGNVTAPAVPASTVAATNLYPHDVRVHIYGGTTTVVAINGTTTGLVSPCTIKLLPLETVTITYTVAPAWTWFSE